MRRIGPSRLLLACLAFVLAGSSCTGHAPRPDGILLITLDTTRADHLGCYGNATVSTPNLDALAKESVRFDQAMAVVPNTLPSHASMFTGQYPPVHGVRYNGMFKLGDASVTIAERLHDAGFATGAVPAAFPVYAKSGLAQGFDTYNDLFSEPGAEKLPLVAERSASDVTRLGLAAIKAAGTRPFFVWLHYYDAHVPYKPPFPFSSRFHDHPYDGEIAYVDAQIGELFKELRARGLWDRIAIVVAGDHGEGLYEHGEHMHSQLTYQTTLRVPLLIKAAGVKPGTVIHEPVTLADVAPTVLDLAQLPIPSGLDGISLRPSLSGSEPVRRALYFETLAGSLNFGWSPIEGLRRGKWKLIRSSETELYDLEADPGEAHDLASIERSVAGDLGTALDAALAHWSANASPAEATTAPLDPVALARLASLGYVGSSVTTTRRGGPSPRSKIHLEGELLLLQDSMDDHRYLDAFSSINNVLRDDPDNRFALNAAANASVGLQKYDDARRYGRELLSRYPEFVPGIVTQGRMEAGQKNYAAAEKIFRDGLEKSPNDQLLTHSLALTLVAEKRVEEARSLVEKALALPEADPVFHADLALCRAIEGDAAGATAELSRALAGGFKDVGNLAVEPVFEPLRKVPGFNEALAAKKGA